MQGSSFSLLFLCFPHIIREKYYTASAFIILSHFFFLSFASRRSCGQELLIAVVILFCGPKHCR